MKNAPITNCNESALDSRNYNAGSLPKRTYTVTAEALMHLLEMNEITGMESVFRMSTTRLSAVIHYLEKRYAWHIDRHDEVRGTKDGRTSWITVYWLPQATIANAFERGAREWIDRVKLARAEKRKKADECKRIAEKINRSRNQSRKTNSRQSDLWGDL